jgi:XRE family transcriptional regulator, regulator of sulfur utilization
MKAVATQYRKRDIAHAFGAALRAARTERGISQDMLAELCDFDRTYPSLLERGLRGPTVAMLFRLADALGTEPARLVTDAVERLRRVAQTG